MSETTKKKSPGLSKKTREEMKETFNAFKDSLGLDLRILAGNEGTCTITDEDDNILDGMEGMSGLTLCRAIEVAAELVKHQTQFSTEHVNESLRGAPAQADEVSDFVSDLEEDEDEDDQAVAV